MNKLVDKLLFLAAETAVRSNEKEAFDIGLLLYEMVEEQSSIDEAHHYHVNAPANIRRLQTAA
jgi:hypothetical protein